MPLGAAELSPQLRLLGWAAGRWGMGCRSAKPSTRWYDTQANCPCVGHHQKHESMTKVFVCYHAVTALTECFCQNAFASREAMAAGSRACHFESNSVGRPIPPSRQWGSARPLNCPDNPGQPLSGAMGRRQLTDALPPPLCLRATLRLKDRSLSCATNALLNTCKGHRFAQAALKSCGSLEQPRDLGTCPTFMSLTAELVACRTSRQRTSRQRTSRQHEPDHPHDAGRNGGHH
jgi:hypothetical protein